MLTSIKQFQNLIKGIYIASGIPLVLIFAFMALPDRYGLSLYNTLGDYNYFSLLAMILAIVALLGTSAVIFLRVAELSNSLVIMGINLFTVAAILSSLLAMASGVLYCIANADFKSFHIGSAACGILAITGGYLLMMVIFIESKIKKISQMWSEYTSHFYILYYPC